MIFGSAYVIAAHVRLVSRLPFGIYPSGTQLVKKWDLSTLDITCCLFHYMCFQSAYIWALLPPGGCTRFRWPS